MGGAKLLILTSPIYQNRLIQHSKVQCFPQDLWFRICQAAEGGQWHAHDALLHRWISTSPCYTLYNVYCPALPCCTLHPWVSTWWITAICTPRSQPPVSLHPYITVCSCIAVYCCLLLLVSCITDLNCNCVYLLTATAPLYHNKLHPLYHCSLYIYGRNQSGCEKAKNLGFLTFILWVFLTIYIWIALMKITKCFNYLEANHIMSWNSWY